MTASSQPRLARQGLRASAARAFGVALAVAVLLAWAARFVLPVSTLFPAVVTLIFAAVMLLVIGSLPHRHPFGRFGAANQVTTIRAALAVLVAALVAEEPLPVLA